MTNEENAPEAVVDNSEAETQVQSPEVEEAPTPAQQGANKPRSLDRFSRGSIAAVSAVLGIVIGMGGSQLMDHHDGGRDDHHGGRFGMERGGWGGRDGGPGGPPPMMYGQGGAQQVAPGAQQAAPSGKAAPAQPTAPNGR